jgi:flagellar motor switch protein FliM
VSETATAPPGAAMNQHILSQDEVDALLQGITSDGESTEPVAAAPGEVRAHDLTSPERRVRARMPALEVVNERFARNIRAGMFELARKTPEVAIGGVKVQQYSAFLREIVVPTNFNIVSVQPLRGSALIVCDPNLVFAVIDALFGGSGKYPARIEGRDFSATEQRVIGRLLQTVCGAYEKAWRGIYALRLALQRSEMQPQFAAIASANDVVVTTSFTLEMGEESSGAIHFCLPYAMLEPIRDLLYREGAGERGGDADPRWLHLLQTQIQSAEVDLVAELATAQATVEQLLSFKPGDFIELDLDPAIQAKVDGVPILDCHYGTANNRYAIKIDRLIASSTQGWLGAENVR